MSDFLGALVLPGLIVTSRVNRLATLHRYTGLYLFELFCESDASLWMRMSLHLSLRRLPAGTPLAAQ